MNQKNKVAVCTPVGMTERVDINNILMQGSTLAPLLCSNSCDSLGKKSQRDDEYLHKYKNHVKIPVLGAVDDLLGVAVCGKQAMDMNIFINSQIEFKKLQFHLPDSKGKSKCKYMHIGPKNSPCYPLKVHDSYMQQVSSIVYLGDSISCLGTNKENIEQRVSKCIGIVSQIMNILNTASFGRHYFKMALLLRESMLINGMLSSAEIWYILTRKDVNSLEAVDKILLSKVTKSNKVSNSYTSYCLEFGIQPLDHIIKTRRIKYLFYILTRNPESMLYKFFICQWNNQTRGDWSQQVEKDLKDLEIPINFSWIKSHTKSGFKTFVNKQSKIYTFKYLREKQQTYSKLRNLKYSDFKMQSYLCSNLSNDIMRNIFLFGTRMSPFCENFHGSRKETVCPFKCE